MKKIILSLLILLASFGSEAQSGWTSGNYYAYQGQSITQTGYFSAYNPWCNCYQNLLHCRQLSWYQEYRSGYVYYWGPNGWYSEWKEGYFWYCTWTAWYVC